MERSPTGTTGPAGTLYCARNKHWVQKEQFDVKNAATGELYKQCDDCRAKVSTPSGAQIGMMQIQAELEQLRTQVNEHDGRLRALEIIGNLMGADDKGADVAEWLPLKDRDEDIAAADVVEMIDGTISRLITGTGLVFVLSTRPMFVGNRPSKADDERSGRAVVLLGHAPVRTRGAVKAGQILVPCGNGAAKVGLGGEYTGHCKIIALESSSDDATTVRCLVHTGAADETAKIPVQLNALCTRARGGETQPDGDDFSWAHALKHDDDDSVSDVTGESLLPPPFVGLPADREATDYSDAHFESLAETHPSECALLGGKVTVKDRNATTKVNMMLKMVSNILIFILLSFISFGVYGGAKILARVDEGVFLGNVRVDEGLSLTDARVDEVDEGLSLVNARVDEVNVALNVALTKTVTQLAETKTANCEVQHQLEATLAHQLADLQKELTREKAKVAKDSTKTLLALCDNDLTDIQLQLKESNRDLKDTQLQLSESQRQLAETNKHHKEITRLADDKLVETKRQLAREKANAVITAKVDVEVLPSIVTNATRMLTALAKGASMTPAVAAMLNGLVVTVHGRHIINWGEDVRDSSRKEEHPGKITNVLENKFEITFNTLVNEGCEKDEDHDCRSARHHIPEQLRVTT